MCIIKGPNLLVRRSPKGFSVRLGGEDAARPNPNPRRHLFLSVGAENLRRLVARQLATKLCSGVIYDPAD